MVRSLGNIVRENRVDQSIQLVPPLQIRWVSRYCFMNTQLSCEYGKWPKISNTKVSNKMTYANSADPDQTAPEGTV